MFRGLPVRSPCRWSGSPRWRWRQVRWRTHGTGATPRFQEFNKTLVLSGNQAGLTADRMLTLSKSRAGSRADV